MIFVPAVVHAQMDFGEFDFDEGGSVEADFSDAPSVREAADEVLARPEFRNLPRLDLGKAGKASDRLEARDKEREQARSVRVPSGSGGPLAQLISAVFGGAASLVVVAVLAVVLGGIIALIVLGLRRWERAELRAAGPADDSATDDEPEPHLAPGEKPADQWLAAARAAATAGRFDEALALLLLGAMGHTERSGLIRPRRGLTYRDYLRAIPESSAWHATLDRLIRAYAPVGFGRRIATVEAFDALVGPYEAALAAEPTPGMSATSIS